MMPWNMAAQVVLWLLAAMGFLLMIRTAWDKWLWPPAVRVAVKIQSKQDADNLDILLCEASKQLHRRDVPVAVLIPARLLWGEIGDGGELYAAYQTVMAAYSAEIYVIDQPPSA